MMKKYLIVGIVLLSCGCSSIQKTYVEADRKTFEAVSPEYAGYVKSDTKFNEAQKTLRLQTLDSWKNRISAAEEEKDAQE